MVTALQDLLFRMLQLNHVGYEVVREIIVLLTDGLLPVQMHVLFNRVFHLDLGRGNNQKQVHVELLLLLRQLLNVGLVVGKKSVELVVLVPQSANAVFER